MAKGRHLKENIVRALEIPEDLAFGDTVVTLTGRNQAVIGNYRRILCYTGDQIVVSAFHGKITLSGRNLRILSYTSEEMTVTGLISDVKMDDRRRIWGKSGCSGRVMWKSESVEGRQNVF